jgi:hypothetical protein
MQTADRADVRARLNTVNDNAARTAMINMTTRSSTKVHPLLKRAKPVWHPYPISIIPTFIVMIFLLTTPLAKHSTRTVQEAVQDL